MQIGKERVRWIALEGIFDQPDEGIYGNMRGGARIIYRVHTGFVLMNNYSSPAEENLVK